MVKENKKLSNWKNEPSFNDLYSDYTSALDDHDIYIEKLSEWKTNLEGGKELNVAPGRSKVQPKLIRKQAEWKYPALEEPFLNTQDMYEVNPRTFEDEKAANQNDILINYQWATKVNKTKLVGDIVRNIVDEGTVIVKTGWEAEEDTVMVSEEHPVFASPEESMMMMQQAVQTGQMAPEEAQAMMETGEPMQIGTEIIQVEKTVLTKNQPTYEVCNNANVIIDPTCEGKLDDAQFVIHEYETDLSSLKKQEYTCEVCVDEETGQKTKHESGIYKNLDKLKIGETDLEGESEQLLSDELEYDGRPAFEFKDKARRKIKAYEYWGYWDIDGTDETVAIVATWVGKTLIRLEENPFPHGKLPFSLAPYMPVKGEVHGVPDGELLIENQESIGKMTRAAHDITSSQAIGQEFINEQFFSSPLQKDNYKAGRTVYFRNGMDPRTSIHKQNVDPVPNTVFQMIQMQSADAESMSGTKAFTGGISGQALGTMLDVNTPIPMIDGTFKLNGALKDGDVIIGSDGKGTTVIKAHDAALPIRAYDMEFSNGSTVKAGGEHLWTVKVTGTKRSLREWHTVDTDTIMEYMSKYQDNVHTNIYIPKMQRVHTTGTVESKIDPYLLGYWLGDGSSHGARITTEDAEVVKSYENAGYILTVDQDPEGSKAKSYNIVDNEAVTARDKNGKFKNNGSFHSILRDYNLVARYGGEKHIPEEYFSASYETKLELVRGLMDSDGYAHSGAFNIFCQAEGRLKDDFIRLIYSMGATPRISKFTTAEELNSRKAKCAQDLKIKSNKDMYEIGFTLLDNPFRLTRKAARYKEPKNTKSIKLNNIKLVDKVLMRCITVDAEDSLYAVGKEMTLTHNTATGVRSAMDATSKRELSILRRLSTLFEDMARKTIAMNQVYLDEQEVIRVTNTEFQTIRREDIQGEFDLKVDVSTPEKDNETAQDLAMIIQTGAADMDPLMVNKVWAKILKLKKHPDLAEEFERAEAPQPSEAEQKMMELNMRNAEMQSKLLEMQIMKAAKDIEEADARIVERYSRAEENEVDQELKVSKTRLQDAQATKLSSEADKIDLAFMKDFSVDKDDDKHKREMEKLEHKRLSELDKMAFSEIGKESK